MAKILVVDDNEINRLVIVKLLGRHNFQVEEAVDGAAGLAAAQANPPDLVFTDLLMPKMDGYELIRQLRAHPPTAKIPIIVYSTLYMARGANELAKTYGVAEVLTKPSKPEAILKAVNDALGLTEQPANGRNLASLHLDLFLEITQWLGLEREPPRLLDNFCERARKLIGAQGAVIGIPELAKSGFQYLRVSGVGIDEAQTQVLPMFKPILSRAMAERQVIPLPEVEPAIATVTGIHSGLAAPIATAKQSYGWLCLVNKLEGQSFKPEEERLLGTLSSQLGMAFENIHLNTELGQKVSQYSAQLEAAQREREAFSQFVAQDVRTPLRKIASQTRVLADKPGSETDETRILKQIYDNASQTEKLITDMLVFSQIGRKDLEIAPVNLTTLAQTVVAELQQSNPSYHHNVIVQPLPTVNADVSLLKTSLTCLFANAFKFTRKSAAPAIEFGMRPNGTSLAYYVKDNGVGFDGQHAEKVFEMFSRLHPAEEYEGKGIGLAITKRAIERMGGKIWAESQPNFGATFYFTLP